MPGLLWSQELWKGVFKVMGRKALGTVNSHPRKYPGEGRRGTEERGHIAVEPVSSLC